MPRKSRLFIQGLPHLIKLRGHNSTPLFRTPDDYHHFLNSLDRGLLLYQVKLYAYAIAPEHILLFLETTDKENLSHFMRYIGSGYVAWYNHRYHRCGALWVSRYWSSPVEPQAYFLLVKKFVEQVNAGQEGYHSFADGPAVRFHEHPCWLSLGHTPAQRNQQYNQFCQRKVSESICMRITIALEKNCLLATPLYRKSMENLMSMSLTPRSVGRPRKYHNNPVENYIRLDNKVVRILEQYCYQEVKIPLLDEPDEENQWRHFAADYHIIPLNKKSLLGGNGTFGCLRLVSNSNELRHKSRLWYKNTVFYVDNNNNYSYQPQYQLGVEAYGHESINIELEQIALQVSVFNSLKLMPFVELKINTLGTPEELNTYRTALKDYLGKFISLFNAKQMQWFETQPEVLLKNDDALLQVLKKDAPRLSAFLSLESLGRFEKICKALDKMGISYTHDPQLYPVNDYCHLVFEWYCDKLPSPAEPFVRGGRYDCSASRLTKSSLYACGFVFNMDSLMHLFFGLRKNSPGLKKTDVTIVPLLPGATHDALLLAESLRKRFQSLSISCDFSGRRYATCLKNARTDGSRFIVSINGDDVTFTDIQTDKTLFIPRVKLVEVLGSSLLF